MTEGLQLSPPQTGLVARGKRESYNIEKALSTFRGSRVKTVRQKRKFLGFTSPVPSTDGGKRKRGDAAAQAPKKQVKPQAPVVKKVKGVLTSWEYSKLSPLEKLEEAHTRMLSSGAGERPRNNRGKPGGLVEFPADERREFILVGDIHTNRRNLRAILKDSGNLRKLEENKAVIVFLGDIVHDERTGHLLEMDSSIEIMDIMLHLIYRFPGNVVYLLGNHDTFDPQLSKSSIQQGKVYREALVQSRGERYTEEMEEFFASLPLFVKHPHFLAVHGGPVRGGIGRSELINIDAYPESRHQLIWNRINETRSTPSRKEYANEDLEELRKALRCPGNIPVIVGHNPMWKWGGDDSIWINPLQTHDHVILYSGAETICPFLSVCGSFEYSVCHANLQLKKKRFVLD
jgi:predicted phosphodiesterase